MPWAWNGMAWLMGTQAPPPGRPPGITPPGLLTIGVGTGSFPLEPQPTRTAETPAIARAVAIRLRLTGFMTTSTNRTIRATQQGLVAGEIQLSQGGDRASGVPGGSVLTHPCRGVFYMG